MSIVLVFSVTSYLLILGRKDVSHEHLTVVLAAQTVLTLLALFGLAVFTTHRLAGPLIALRRAMDEVKAGNLDKGLQFRRSDPHLHELETSFNEMLAALRERRGMDRSASAGG
jgi:nitrogen fixation/metabolism regulation signal transduction histidine kinase